ncbi:MAG: alpha-glucosidase [Christensenellaceae bacterium]|nr:alpha-glucosidase [Christensenellaceae bacterium]
MDWKKSVVYQIYPRSFMDSNDDGIGDIRGIIKKLDYLKLLGIDIIWLSPIYKSPDKDNGYDISDYYDISEKFGTLDDFKELLEEAHNRGIKILMDLVVNHTSDMHPWFIESRSSKDNPKRDFYIWRDGFGDKKPTTQYGFFNEPVWQYDEKTDQYYFHNFAVEQPELNWENEEVREEVYKMMNTWLDMGVDGFRMDVINLISKPEATLRVDGGPGAPCENGPRVHEFLQEMNKKTFSNYNTITVGETPGVSVEEAKKYANLDGSELDMVFQFELVGIEDKGPEGKWHTRKIKLSDFKRVTNHWQTGLHGKAWNSLYLSNHDQPRCVSRFGNTSSEFLREKSAKMLATILHFQQGTPYVYQGEELGMTNYTINSLDDCRDYEVFSVYKDLVEDKKIHTEESMLAALNERCRDHARTPMQWNDDVNAGFSKGEPWIEVNPNYKTINAEAQINDENSIFNYYKKLIALRKELPVMVDGNFELLLPDSEEIFAYTRNLDNCKLTIVANYTDKIIKCDGVKPEGEILICNYPNPKNNCEQLQPYEARVFIKK